MSGQDPDTPVTKSGVRRTENPASMQQGFDEGDKVRMSVTENKRRMFKDFTVKAAKLTSGHWKYQLNDENGNVYDGGNWFGETDLRER